jgi:hypothetical protein
VITEIRPNSLVPVSGTARGAACRWEGPPSNNPRLSFKFRTVRAISIFLNAPAGLLKPDRFVVTVVPLSVSLFSGRASRYYRGRPGSQWLGGAFHVNSVWLFWVQNRNILESWVSFQILFERAYRPGPESLRRAAAALSLAEALAPVKLAEAITKGSRNSIRMGRLLTPRPNVETSVALV